MKTAIILLTVATVVSSAQGFSAIPRPVSQDQILTGTSSLEGTVLNSVTGAPIRKATVFLGAMPWASAVTDASGHFAFRQLPEGQYFPQAQSEDYTAAQGEGVTTAPQEISLAKGEQKKDVELTLSPGASLGGTIVDEEGNPLPRCTVSLMQYRETDAGRALQAVRSEQSGVKGEFRTTGLTPGKYFVMARCPQTLTLPHAFVPRDSTMDLPSLSYPARFYPGVSDAAGATRIEAALGGKVSGIEFRMSPATGVTVRGRVIQSVRPNLNIMLAPTGQAGDWQTAWARLDQQTGEFRIANVLPGSYELIASDYQSHYAKVSIVVGATSPEPIELQFSPLPQITGSVSVEGGDKTSIKNLRIGMNALIGQRPYGVQGETQPDGTFTLNPVVPGRWRIFVTNVPGYVKSMAWGDREVSPDDFEVSASPSGPLNIAISTKYAQVDLGLADPPAGATPVFGMMWKSGYHGGFQQNFMFKPQGRIVINAPPGKYIACAFESGQNAVMQSSSLRKELESRCEKIEASETARIKVQLPLISVQDLKRLMDKLDE